MFGNLKQKLLHYTWDLAYFNLSNNKITEFESGKAIIIKNPYRTKWFADPFVLSYSNGKLELLVEEFDSNIKRGRIARLLIDTNKRIIEDCVIVLDLPTHLSFPAIYRENNVIYVTPENSASGALFIYEYDRERDKLVNQQLLHPEPLTDAIISKIGEKYKMYATCLPNPNGNCLYEYESDNFLGPYKKTSELVYNRSTARMAGYIIHEDDGKIIRPAQDCTNGYGEAVILFEKDKELKRIAPPGMFMYSGLHTFNTFGEVGVIDLKKYDYYIVVKMKDLVKRLIR